MQMHGSRVTAPISDNIPRQHRSCLMTQVSRNRMGTEMNSFCARHKGKGCALSRGGICKNRAQEKRRRRKSKSVATLYWTAVMSVADIQPDNYLELKRISTRSREATELMSLPHVRAGKADFSRHNINGTVKASRVRGLSRKAINVSVHPFENSAIFMQGL